MEHPTSADRESGLLTVFLCGDVMTGRGIDQVLPHPSDPRIHESFVKDAGQYDARIVNLETSITRSDDHWSGKGIHYRMHPDNVQCLAAAGIDVCGLANNHVLDFGHAGLRETLETLTRAGLRTAGAGRILAEAREPAVVEISGKGRLVVFALGDGTSGIPSSWAATTDRPGIDFLPDLSEATATGIVDRIRRVKQARGLVVASIHWGNN